MKKLEQEFVKNIGQTGNHVFKQLKAGTATNGKPIYIYSRTYQGGIHDGQIFSYETIIANTKAAGEYKFPQGITTYDEDFEEYATTCSFGRLGWEHSTYELAEKKFNELAGNVEKKSLDLPDEEFTIKDVIELNHVQYPVAAKFVKEQIELKKVTFIREEKLAARGKASKIYKTT